MVLSVPDNLISLEVKKSGLVKKNCFSSLNLWANCVKHHGCAPVVKVKIAHFLTILTSNQHNGTPYGLFFSAPVNYVSLRVKKSGLVKKNFFNSQTLRKLSWTRVFEAKNRIFSNFDFIKLFKALNHSCSTAAVQCTPNRK